MATDCFDVCGLICGHQLIQNGHSTQETLNGYADKGVKIDLLSVRGDYRRFVFEFFGIIDFLKHI
jgi:hypothetical protein